MALFDSHSFFQRLSSRIFARRAKKTIHKRLHKLTCCYDHVFLSLFPVFRSEQDFYVDYSPKNFMSLLKKICIDELFDWFHQVVLHLLTKLTVFAAQFYRLKKKLFFKVCSFLHAVIYKKIHPCNPCKVSTE